MKLYVPPDVDPENLRNGWWQLYADVICMECGKEHALSNCPDLKCVRCGGKCK